ncbi:MULTISPECIES: hypothetical protein [unclassified Corynebacterium]|uniref:hypothetical protein n=1 Tax=unclassified Corynebacterium TaxID=2624378 RepID=UPI0029C9BB37|nr:MULTISPECIES: hypothetical protein [unclassified Corynebacterium]WPF66528.1 hypothetical protein OLX12_02015 [Corynebacterium sp. 22KM0430]WPF69017.1 hypothetical protein OLW90_02010 [Corynebacterium sp. 21KM1197]
MRGISVEDISIAPQAIRAMVKRGLEELEERIGAHGAAPPALPTHAVGQAFREQAVRLSEVYRSMHAEEITRMQRLSALLRDVLRDIDRVEDTDREHARDMERWG